MKNKHIIVAVNPKNPKKLVEDMVYLTKLLRLQSVMRDRYLEEMFKTKYNIKLEYKKKNGNCYYICNKSDKQIAELIQTKIK